MKVFLTEHDTFNFTTYTEEEALDMFGYTVEEDSEVFVDIPDELVLEYKEAFEKFWELNAKISDYKIR